MSQVVEFTILVPQYNVVVAECDLQTPDGAMVKAIVVHNEKGYHAIWYNRLLSKLVWERIDFPPERTH